MKNTSNSLFNAISLKNNLKNVKQIENENKMKLYQNEVRKSKETDVKKINKDQENEQKLKKLQNVSCYKTLNEFKYYLSKQGTNENKKYF